MAAPVDPKRPDETLEQYLARIRPKPEPPPAPPTFDADLIPEETPVNPRFQQEREEVDAVLGRMDIVEAYNRYCHKMHCDPKGKTQSIMVSCPFPGHEDKDPSAQMTTEKGDGGVGNCPLDGGFDKYDLAAWYYGFDVPGYKEGANFPELRRKMAEGMGYTFMVQGKDEWLVKSQPETQVPKMVSNVSTATGETLPTTPQDPIQLDDWRDIERPKLDWRLLPFITSDTFMHEWMTETSQAHQPEEYFFFQGMMALGLAVGDKVHLKDETPVRPNMMICLVGGTGTGKSRSVRQFEHLLDEAIPFHETSGGGTKWIHSPGSGEDLIAQMIHWTQDPVTKDKTFYPVRGMLYEDEFEGLMAKVNRMGSSYRPSLMKFFDSSRPVSTSSRTGGTHIARDHFLQVLTTTQPGRLGTLMTAGDATSGFLNRWLFVFGTPKYRPSISNVQVNIKDAATKLQTIRAWSSPGREVYLDMDPTTVSLWDSFVQNQIRPLEDTDEVLVARIELQCKKLLLLMAINDRSTTVMEKHLESLSLMFPYLKSCYGIVEENVGHTELQDCIDAMKKYFINHPDEDVSMRILEKQSAARKYDQSTRLRAIEILTKSGEVNEVPHAKGAKVIRWKWVPDNAPTGPGLATVTPLFPIQ